MPATWSTATRSRKARARGWEEFENGELLTIAEAAGFEVLVTTDKNIVYQQILSSRKIDIVVSGKGRWRLLKPYVSKIVAAVSALKLNQLEQAGRSYRDRSLVRDDFRQRPVPTSQQPDV